MFSLSWVIGFGENAQGGTTDNVQLGNVIAAIELVLNESGSVTLDIIDGDEIGPESLQVETEGGKSVISLGENTRDDYVVHTYTNESAVDGKVSILGNEWDLKMVCEDSNIIKTIFKEFVLTNKVSKNILT
jgi:hypothetical protein